MIAFLESSGSPQEEIDLVRSGYRIPPKSATSKRPLGPAADERNFDDIEEPLDSTNEDPSWLHVLVPDELEEEDLRDDPQPKKVKVEDIENETPIERRRRKARENAKKRKDRKALQIKVEQEAEDEADIEKEQQWENSDGSGNANVPDNADTEEESTMNNVPVEETAVDKAARQRAAKAAWQRNRRAEKKRELEAKAGKVEEVDEVEEVNMEDADAGNEKEENFTKEDEAKHDSEISMENFESDEVEEVDVEEDMEEEVEMDEEVVDEKDVEEEVEDEVLTDSSKNVEVVDVEKEDAINEKENSIFYNHLVKDKIREDEISDDEVEAVHDEEEDISDSDESEPFKNLIDSYLEQERDDREDEEELEQCDEANSNENESVVESIENIKNFLDDEETEDSALEIYPDEDDEDEDEGEVKEEGIDEESNEDFEDEVPAEERVSVSEAAHEDMSLVFQKNPVAATAADLQMLSENHNLMTTEINLWFIRIREKTRGMGDSALVEFFNKFTKKHTRDGMVSF